jgi:hypothetical protein
VLNLVVLSYTCRKLGERSALGGGGALPRHPNICSGEPWQAPVSGLASPEFGFPLSPTTSHTSSHTVLNQEENRGSVLEKGGCSDGAAVFALLGAPLAGAVLFAPRPTCNPVLPALLRTPTPPLAWNLGIEQVPCVLK